MTIPFEKRTVQYIHTPLDSGKKVSGKTTPETWKLMKDGYVVLKDFIPKDVLNMTLDNWRTVEENPNWESAILYREVNDITHSSPESSIGKSKAGYCTPWGVALHRYIKEKLINTCIDMELRETYSYTRKYERGAFLTAHTDRPSCEISATLCLDYQTDDNTPWKIWLQNDENYIDNPDSDDILRKTQGIPPRSRKNAISISLEPGDILLYQGPNVPHWRDTLVGDFSYHIFVHFFNDGTMLRTLPNGTFTLRDQVDHSGDNCILEYDGRVNRYVSTEDPRNAHIRPVFNDYIQYWDNLGNIGLKKSDFTNNYSHLSELKSKKK